MKKIVLFLILVLFTLPVYAKPTTFERTEDNKWGVNKHWNITDKNINHVKRTPYVDAKEKIYDFANLLTDEEEQELRLLINDYIERTKMDLVIVTTSFQYYTDKVNEDYAADFYDYNDFGLDFDKYSGTLLLRNNNPEDKYYNLYTFGEAQLYYNYDRLENILDDIYEDMVSGNYYYSFSTVVNKLSYYYSIGKPYSANSYYVDDNGYLHHKYVFPLFWGIILPFVISLIVCGHYSKKNKMIRKAIGAHTYLDRSKIKFTTATDKLIHSHVSRIYNPPSSSGGGGSGGYSSSGGSSGGGHSSGGGRHG